MIVMQFLFVDGSMVYLYIFSSFNSSTYYFVTHITFTLIILITIGLSIATGITPDWAFFFHLTVANATPEWYVRVNFQNQSLGSTSNFRNKSLGSTPVLVIEISRSANSRSSLVCTVLFILVLKTCTTRSPVMVPEPANTDSPFHTQHIIIQGRKCSLNAVGQAQAAGNFFNYGHQ